MFGSAYMRSEGPEQYLFRTRSLMDEPERDGGAGRILCGRSLSLISFNRFFLYYLTGLIYLPEDIPMRI